MTTPGQENALYVLLTAGGGPCSAVNINAFGTASGMNVYAENRDGITVSANGDGRGVFVGFTSRGTGVLGVSKGTGSLSYGVHGESPNVGVLGDSDASTGVVGRGLLTGVYGQSTGPAPTALGVGGYSANGTGVFASSSTGKALVVQGRAQFEQYHDGSAAPSSGAHGLGEIARDAAGNLWVCIAEGTPGIWVTIAGPGAGGAYHGVSPSRVYDSRSPASAPLAAGNSRTVTVANKVDNAGVTVLRDIVPAGATSVAINLTITGTTSGGYLAVNEGGNTTVSASAINWSASGQTIANGLIVPVNANREVTVIAGGDGGSSTNFIIDVSGYYR
jgi:hypothetical protein